MFSQIQVVFKLDERRKTIIQSVLFFSCIAHLFRYTNAAFNSDSLGIFRGGGDITKQIARGRWLQPLYLYLRGSISSPFLIGLLATLYLAISIILITEILEIKNNRSIIALCGLLSVAPAITISNAAFVPWTDIFMLSLLFSMIGAYWLTIAHGMHKNLIGGLFIVLSLALYQSYFDACMLICVFWLLRSCLSGDKTGNIIKSAAIMVLVFVLSLIVYYWSFRAVCAMILVQPSDSYNSVAATTVLSGSFNPLALIIETYLNVFRYVIRPETFHSTLAGCINVAFLLISAVLVLFFLKRKETDRIIIAFLLLAFCPLAAYFVYILYGRNDSLITFPVWMQYIGIAVLFEFEQPDMGKRIKEALSQTLFIFACILIFFGVVYSNQIYLKKNVEEQETLSLMTRVLFHMEQIEEYVPGETKVALVGSLLDSKAYTTKPGYNSLEGRTLKNEVAIMYYKNYRMYLSNILGYPINLVEQKEAESISQRKEAKEMPAFPSSGCTKMIGDTLVVKLSDNEE